MSDDGSRGRRGGRLVLLCLLLSIAAAELVLQGAGWGLWGSARWRQLAYQYGAFWAGLLHGWHPNYTAQPYVMFFSYAFLHSGFGHMFSNLAATVPLGLMVLERRRGRDLALVWLAAIPGGGLGFGLLATSAAPMVGASGAVFGLAGALVTWRWQEDRAAGQPATMRALVVTAGLVALNLVMWLSLGGMMAWETHLGGFIAGAVMAMLLRPN